LERKILYYRSATTITAQQVILSQQIPEKQALIQKVII